MVEDIFVYDTSENVNGDLRIQYRNCEMLIDFGPFQAGHEYEWIDIDYEKGTMTGGGTDLEAISCPIKIEVDA